MEEESTSDSLSIQSPILLQDSVPEINESFDHQQYQESQNEISFEYSQQFNFPHSQKDVNDDTHISSSSSLAIGNLHGSGSILSPALAPAQSLFAQISELIPLAQQNQTQAISSSKYKTTIDMLEDLDSQLPDYSLHKRSKYENMSQLSNYRPNSQITPAGLRQGTNIKPVQVNKELISSILKKLPWLNLSVNTISQNLSQHEVKILLRYKNIDVHSTSGVKKTALCETLLRVLREDRFKEEMLSINAHVTTGSISSISSVVIADKSIGRPGSSLISSSEKGNSVIADASTGDKDRPALSYSSSTSISTSDKTPIPIIKSSPHQEVQTIGSGSGSASANQKSVAGQTTLQSKTPKCQISSDFFNDSKWRPPSVSYSLLTTPVVEKARPVSSLVYFRDREECINSSGLFEPTPSNRGRTDSQSTRCESMKGWKQIQSKGIEFIDDICIDLNYNCDY